MTANNPVLSRELTRRSVRIRIDPKIDRPWLREDFHHDDLRAWVQAHRPELVWAALTLVRAWLAADSPRPTARPLGSYEDWSRVIGGVLTTAGIPGFLGNLQEFYAVANTESEAWRALVAVWWNIYQDTPITAGELLPLALQFDELEIGGKDEGGQRRSLGRKLASQRERVIGRYRIVGAGEHANALRWKLVPAPDLGEHNSPNSPKSPDPPETSNPGTGNSPQKTLGNLKGYQDDGELGEFHSTAAESSEKNSLQIGATDSLPRAAHAPAGICALTKTQGTIQIELPLDIVMRQFLESQPETWTSDHVICRYDRHEGYVVGVTAPALDAFAQFVAATSVFGSEAQRHHYTATLQWLVDHGVSPQWHRPYPATQTAEILPNQLPLL
jgi:hypothetical protein